MKSLRLLPHMTEKSLSLTSHSVYQFVVPVWATKKQIEELVERHFGVSVLSVKTARMPSKAMIFRRLPGRQAAWKKASVQLKKGDTIAEFSLPVEADSPPTTDEPKPTTEKAPESQITVRSKSKKEGSK